MNETKYEEIQKMWRNAYAVMIAPKGFRKTCEEYIWSTLRDVLKTEVLITKSNAVFGELNAIRVNVVGGKIELDIKGYDEPRTLYELDEDQDVNAVVEIVYGYAKQAEYAEIKADVDKDGVTTPYREVNGLIVKPLPSLEGEFRFENGVFYVSQNDFYKDIDSYLLEAMSFNIDNIKELYKSVEKNEADRNEEYYKADKLFRKVAAEYLKREMWQNSLRGYIEFPCDDKTFEVIGVAESGDENDIPYEDAQLDKIYVGKEDGELYFQFSNGREEDIDMIEIEYLWTIVYSIEYRKTPHYEKLSKMAEDMQIVTNLSYAEKAKDFIYWLIYEKHHSSRWGLWNEDLSLTIMDKNNIPIGTLVDVVCKRGNVVVEINPEWIPLYPKDNRQGRLSEIDFDELSPISMAHLVEYIGHDEEKYDLSHLRHFEKDETKVPYRIWKGKMIGMTETTWDNEMAAIAIENGILKCVVPDAFYHYTDEELEHVPMYEKEIKK